MGTHSQESNTISTISEKMRGGFAIQVHNQLSCWEDDFVVGLDGENTS